MYEVTLFAGAALIDVVALGLLIIVFCQIGTKKKLKNYLNKLKITMGLMLKALID